jgi:hypothetical protein
MRIAFLVKIIHCEHTNKISYEKIDTFLETIDNQETLEIQIIKKYPTMTEINHCDCNIVYDKITGEKYLIVSSFL